VATKPPRGYLDGDDGTLRGPPAQKLIYLFILKGEDSQRVRAVGPTARSNRTCGGSVRHSPRSFPARSHPRCSGFCGTGCMPSTSHRRSRYCRFMPSTSLTLPYKRMHKHLPEPVPTGFASNVKSPPGGGASGAPLDPDWIPAVTTNSWCRLSILTVGHCQELMGRQAMLFCA
jgi:hypothetical protein